MGKHGSNIREIVSWEYRFWIVGSPWQPSEKFKQQFNVKNALSLPIEIVDRRTGNCFQLTYQCIWNRSRPVCWHCESPRPKSIRTPSRVPCKRKWNWRKSSCDYSGNIRSPAGFRRCPGSGAAVGFNRKLEINHTCGVIINYIQTHTHTTKHTLQF